MKNRIITCGITRGGAGKSSTIAALAQYAVQLGKQILVVDVDPQGNVTNYVNGSKNHAGSYALLTGEAAATSCIQTTPQGIDLICGSVDLGILNNVRGGATVLATALQPLRQEYDLVLIDTAPFSNVLLFAALYAATDLLVPVEVDTPSIDGLVQVIDLGLQVRRKTGLRMAGIILTRYDGRSSINKYLKSQIEQEAAAMGVPVLGTIRQGIKVKEAQATRRSLFEYYGREKVAGDYRAVFDAIFEQERLGIL